FTLRAEVFQKHSVTLTNQTELATVRVTGFKKAGGNELMRERDHVIRRNVAHAHVIRFSAVAVFNGAVTTNHDVVAPRESSAVRTAATRHPFQLDLDLSEGDLRER